MPRKGTDNYSLKLFNKSMESPKISKLSKENSSFNTFTISTLKSLRKPNILKYISQTDRVLGNQSSSSQSKFDKIK